MHRLRGPRGAEKNTGFGTERGVLITTEILEIMSEWMARDRVIEIKKNTCSRIPMAPF